MGTYVADQRGHLNAHRLVLGDNHPTGLLDPSLALLHDVPLAGVLVILPGTLGVLQRRELVLAAHFDGGKLLQRRQGEDVKDELLQLDAVGLLGLEGLAGFGQDARDLLAGNVVGQLVRPGLDRVEESEGVVVVDNVGGPELQHVGLLGVLGLGRLLVDLGVLDHVGLAVSLQDQAHRLGGVTLANNLGGDVDVLRGGKSNEHGVGNLDQAVVHTVVVDVLDAPLPHVLSHAGREEGLVDSTVSIGGNGNLRNLGRRLDLISLGMGK